MSRRKEKPVQFFLPIGSGTVNQCFLVGEDELEGERASDNTAALLEKALAGKLSGRSLTRHRDALLREAIRTDSAEALACLMPKRRMEPERFSGLLAFAEDCRSPDATALLLAYRGENYSSAEFQALEQRRLDLEFGLAEPDEADFRRLYRLRYLRGGVCICGFREKQRAYEIPAQIGGKAVAGVDAAAFYALDPLPRVHRRFAESTAAGKAQGNAVCLGRAPEKKGGAEAPLSWRVLRREAERTLVLCERPVAVLPYHRELVETSWKNCDLRRWLNTVFLPLAFTEEERGRILSAAVETPDNPCFGSSGGETAEDRLFFLSVEEASAMLADDASRALGCWWWLRTPGFDGSFAAAVTPDGAIIRIGSFVDTDDYAVRPAMWIRTD